MAFGVALVMLVSFSMSGSLGNAWAEGGAAAGDATAMQKFGRGLVNIATFPLEVPRTINNQSQAEGPAYGWTVGIFEGIGMSAVRVGSGAIDVLTAPFDFPGDSKAPLVEPEYAWEDWTKGS